MGLLNTYTAANRVVTQGRTVTYSKSRIYGQWSYVSGMSVITIGSAWEYHRYCQKTYSYVGMDFDTAKTCAQAMITLYTRDFKVSEWDGSGVFVDKNGGSTCMADISIQKRNGHMYDVVISVREDDSRTRTTSLSPSSLFTTENNRDYEEG